MNKDLLVILTKRELEVANLVTDGLTNKEIAKKLSITQRTVRAHLEHIFYKLKINNRVQLVILMFNKNRRLL